MIALRERYVLYYVNGQGQRMFLMNNGIWFNERIRTRKNVKCYSRYGAAINRMEKLNARPGCPLVSATIWT
ncbi:MAG: hypothetical protein A2170_03385 [Deltaproteobacteria bacterium RBG_13_53_10]|nr:MAG: hypothetical protein A2170_03385 [Deltaproteobacteria bacterium RBG_13_53_10]